MYKEQDTRIWNKINDLTLYENFMAFITSLPVYARRSYSEGFTQILASYITLRRSSE